MPKIARLLVPILAIGGLLAILLPTDRQGLGPAGGRADATRGAERDERRELDAVAASKERSVAESAPAAGGESIAHASSAAHGIATARFAITLAETPWMPPGAWSGELVWTPSGGQPVGLEWGPDAANGIELPPGVAPPDLAEIELVTAGRWLARADSIRPTSDGVELVLKLEEGARVDWDPRAPLAVRRPVDVAVGGGNDPDATRVYLYTSEPDGPPLRGLEVPFALPRPSVPVTFWMRPSHSDWSSHEVESGTEQVDLLPEHGATVRVLHDAYDPEDDGCSVVVTSLPGGETRAAEITGPDPVLVHGCRAGRIHVRIGRFGVQQDEFLTPDLYLEAEAGGQYDVDLRSSVLERERGGLRFVLVDGSGLGPHSIGELELQLSQRNDVDADSRWTRLDAKPARDEVADGARTLEFEGLVPGLHRLVLDPVAFVVRAEVVAGEAREVRAVVGPLGAFTVQSTAPSVDGAVDVGTGLMLRRLDEGEEVSILLLTESRLGGAPDTPCAVSPGRYVVEVGLFGEVEKRRTAPFEVRAGETTAVTLETVEDHEVELRAVDATTGDPVGLPLGFWSGVRILDGEGESLVEQVSLTSDGPSDDYTGATYVLRELGPDRDIELPEATYHAFEIAPVQRIGDVDVIELRASPK